MRLLKLSGPFSLLLLVVAQHAQAAVITNGALSITIRGDNGAIGQALFDGSDFFNPGAPVSNYGFQNGTNTGTFVENYTNGPTGQPVSVSAGNVVTGTFVQGGANVDFARSYSLLAGLNVLQITTTFTNHGPGLNLSYFDTYDPDQGYNKGAGFYTYNDVFPLGGGTVGQASINYFGHQDTVIAGSMDSRVTVASGNPFAITSGSLLNNFFRLPMMEMAPSRTREPISGFKRSSLRGKLQLIPTILRSA